MCSRNYGQASLRMGEIALEVSSGFVKPAPSGVVRARHQTGMKEGRYREELLQIVLE